MNDLTPQQISFLTNYVKIPWLLGKKSAKAKRDLWAKEFRAFNAHYEQVRAKLDQIADSAVKGAMLSRANGAEAIVMADTDTPDFAGGHARLDDVARAAGMQILHEQCETEIARHKPMVDRELTRAPANVGEIRMIWGLITERAAKGHATQTRGDMDSALATFPRLRKALLLAAPPETEGAGDRAREGLQNEEFRAKALETLDAESTRLSGIKSRIIASFPDGIPPAITQILGPIETSLSMSRDAEPAELALRAGAVQEGIAQLETTANPLINAAATYADARGKLESGAFAVLQSHRAAGDPLMAAHLTAITKHLDDAKTAADGHDYTEAQKQLDDAIAKTSEALKDADALIRFRELRLERKGRYDQMVGEVRNKDIHTEVRKHYDAVETKWAAIDDANTAGTLDKITKASPHLESLPAEISETIEQYWLAYDFDRRYKAAKDYPDAAAVEIAKQDPTARPELERLNTSLRETLAACAFDKTGDLRKSATIAERAASLKALIKTKLGAAKEYEDAKKAFDDRVTKIETYNGKPEAAAAAAYLAQLRAERTHAQARVTQGDYTMAKRAYESSAAQHDPVLTNVRTARSYFTKATAFDTKVGTVENLPDADCASDEIAAAKALKTAAGTAKDAQDWAGAKAMMVEATSRLDAAEKHIKAHKKMEDLDSADRAGALAALPGDRKPSIDLLNKLLDALKSIGTGSQIGQQCFADCVTQAKAAIKTSAKGNVSDDDARAEMGDAIDAVKNNLAILALFDPFVAQAEAVEQEINALKAERDAPWEAGDVFNPELGDAETLLNEAVNIAGPDTFDVVTGNSKLKEAKVKLAYVQQHKKDACKAVAARDAAVDAIAEVDQPWTQTNEATALADLKTAKTGIDNDLTARDWAKAAAAADKVVAAAGSLEMIFEEGEKYTADKTAHFDPMLVSLPATELYTKAMRDKITAMNTQAATLAAAKSYGPARSIALDVYFMCKSCKELETQGAEYETKRAEAKTALDSMQNRIDAKAGALYDKYLDLRAAYGDGEGLATGMHYVDARKRMEALKRDVDAAEPDVAGYADYLASRKTAGDALADIGRLGDRAAIEPLVVRLFAKHKNAISVGDAGDYKTAKTMFDDIAGECTIALRAAAKHSEYGELVNALKDLSVQDEEGLGDALRRAEAFLDPFQKGPDAFFVLDLSVEARTKLDQAKDSANDDPGAARVDLARVMELCQQMEILAGQFTQLRENADFATKQLTDLLSGHPQAGFIRTEAEAQLAAIETALKAVRGDRAKKDESLNAIEAALKEYHRLRLAADGQIEVAKLDKEISDKMDAMETHAQRYTIAADISLIRTQLDSARKAAGELNQPRALEVLKSAKARQTEALMRASIQGGGVPKKEDLADLLAQPDGSERLDDLVAGLDAKTQRKVMTQVFEARFGTELQIFKDSQYASKEYEDYLRANTNATPQEIQDAYDNMDQDEFIEYLEGESTKTADELAEQKSELEAMAEETPDQFKKRKLDEFKDANPTATPAQINQRKNEIDALAATLNYDMLPDEKAPNLRRFYDLMSKLPDTDTLTNESLGLFSMKLGASDAPYYASQTREVVMIGEESRSPYTTVGLAEELGEIDDDCKPEPGEKMTLLSWNTLHEVGHAVDDKLGFMDRRGNALAGWVEHGSDVRPIAEKIAQKYSYDADYVTAYMSGNENPTMPEPTGGASAAEWELRRGNVRAHVDAIRAGNDPWQSAAGAKASEIDGRCYHEAYDGFGSWVSYDATARSKGVSGYQFRAPGEWFSELYAAYHSGKMNANHPARGWLETL